MNIPFKSLTGSLAAALLFTACGTINQSVREDIAQNTEKSREVIKTPRIVVPASRVIEVRGKKTPVTTVALKKASDWLKAKQIQVIVDSPTPLSAVVDMLGAQGLNVVSDIPLNNITYSGRVNRTDADAALKSILGTVGLDYQADNERKLVLIKPMANRTWYLNIGNRRSSFSSDGSAASSGSGTNSNNSTASNGSSGSSSATTGSLGASNGAGSGSQSTNSTQGTSNSSQGNGASGSSSTNVASADDFWASLASELKNRLTVLVPNTSAATTPQVQYSVPPITAMQQPGFIQPPQPGQGANGSNGAYITRQIGMYSLNPETGAINVQAPHWILSELDVYMQRVIEMYNTDITFSGEIVLVTSNRSDSEGFDLAAFANWASGKYSAVIANNALGGITVSMPSSGLGVPSLSAGAQQVGGPLLGLQFQGGNDAMNIFNAYLSEIGEVSVIQRPLVSTTSGVPGMFSKTDKDYYNLISQQAAAGTTGSAVSATQNTLVQVDLGTELIINPRIDISTGLIRAQVALKQEVKSGTKTIQQTINVGANAVSVPTAITLTSKQKSVGEVLLRDGDLIILGGQTEETMATNESGIPGQTGPMGGLLGVKKASKGAQTHYFALRVTVNKRQ